MLRFGLLLALLAGPGLAAPAELRAGGQVAGHLLFTDVAAVEVQWPIRSWRERTFLTELSLQGGLALSFDGRFLELPALARVELLRWRWVGFELAPGLVLSHYQGTSALTPVVCAGLPIVAGAFRVQPELCVNPTVRPGGPSYRGGLWTGLGLGVFRAF